MIVTSSDTIQKVIKQNFNIKVELTLSKVRRLIVRTYYYYDKF